MGKLYSTMPRPNPPMKLSACGRRLIGKRSVLSAAAAGRSLWALRYANAHRISMATTARLMVSGGAHPGIEGRALQSAPLLAGLVDGASHNKPFKLAAWRPQLKGNR